MVSLHVVLGSLGTFMSFFGTFTNLYVLIVLLLSKKTRSSGEWILLHLSSCGLAASVSNLLCVTPAVFMEKWIAFAVVGCNAAGASSLLLQFLLVWTVCALSVDRCAAIVSPLRYTQVVTRKKIACFFLSLWILSIVIVFTSFFIQPEKADRLTVGDATSTSADISIFTGSSVSTTTAINAASSSITRIVQISDVHDAQFQALSSSSFSQSHATTTTTALESPASDTLSFSSSVGNGVTSVSEWDLSTLAEMAANFSYVSDADESVGTTDAISSSSISIIQDGRNGSTLIEEIGPFKYRALMGICLPRMNAISILGWFWVVGWILFILIAPMITLLICDLTVLSIARKQRHRIIMALYQITAVTQVTVTGSKGSPLPGLWMNRSVLARSKACRAVWEDMVTLFVLHFPLILILVLESLLESHQTPWMLDLIASICLYATPCVTAILYGIRARPLRAAYKSYLRKRLTNTTLQHEIQQRLSPVDGSPRLSNSRNKSFRSATPSPTSSPIMTPRRLSTNDLRPPPLLPLSMSLSPSDLQLGRSNHSNHSKEEISTRKKVRSFLHIPNQIDMQEFWSGLTRPNRSPTIVITHELRSRHSSSGSSACASPTAEQRL